MRSRPLSAPLLSVHTPMRRSASFYNPERSASAWSKGAYVQQDPCGKLLKGYRQGFGDPRGLLDPESPQRRGLRVTSEGKLVLPSKRRPASAQPGVRSKVLEVPAVR